MLKILKEELAAMLAALDALKTKAYGDDATDADYTALKDAIDKVEAKQAKIEMVERTEKALAGAARPADGGVRVPAQAKTATTAEEKLALACQSLMVSKREFGTTSTRNVLKAMEELGYGAASDEFGQINGVNKANSTLTGAAGGLLVAQAFDRTFIDLLYAQSSFMAGNPRRIPMPEGNYRQAGGLTGAVATYRGEGDDIGVSQPTFRDIAMSARLLSTIVPVTNQLLRYSLNEAGAFIRQDGAMAMSLKMDLTGYLGTGTAGVPLGIMRAVGINSYAVTSATTATPTIAQIETEAAKALAILTRFPVLAANAEWRVSPRTWLYLAMLRNNNDERVYPELSNNGQTQNGATWMGLPIRIAQFPENLGAGTNETYIALISFSNVLVGETKGLTIDVSDEAPFKDAGGVMQSLWGTDSTGFKFTMEHDFDVRYTQAVNIITGVKF